MVRDIHIQNFRSVGDVHLSDLRTINVLYGPNGVGKTNILEAIVLLKSASLYWDATDLALSGARISHARFYGTQLSQHRSDKIRLCIAVSVPEEEDFRYCVSFALAEDQKWLFVEEQVWRGDVQICTRRGQEVRVSQKTGRTKKNKEKEFTLVSNKGVVGSLPIAYPLRESLKDFVIYRLALSVLETGVGQKPTRSLGPSGELFPEFVWYLNEQYPERWQAVKNGFRCLHEWVSDVQISHMGIYPTPSEMVSLQRVVTIVDQRIGGTEAIPAYLAGRAIYSLALLTMAAHPLMPPFFAIDDFGQDTDSELVEELTRMFIRLFLQYSPDKQVILATSIPKIGRVASQEAGGQARVFRVKREGEATVVTDG